MEAQVYPFDATEKDPSPKPHDRHHEFVDADGQHFTPPKCLVFPEIWESILRNSSNEDIIQHFKDIQSTMGIVGALLLSVVYGRVGRTEDVDPASIWGDSHAIGEYLMTTINHCNISLCLVLTITAARMYIMLSCFPVERGVNAVAKFGPLFLIDVPYLMMPPVTVLFILDTVIRTSLSVPRVGGIVAVALSFVAAVGAILMFMRLDATAERAITSMTAASRR